MTDAFHITQAFNQLPQAGQVHQLAQQLIELFQNEAFLGLAYEKKRRIDHLRTVFSGHPMPKLLLSNHLRHLSARRSDIETAYLEHDFFAENESSTFEQKCARLEGALVIVNNNDAHAQGSVDTFVHLFNHCTHTIFVIWDWDNHHWLSLSMMLAAHCDLYVPTHPDNLYALSRLNAAITEPVAAGVQQWTTQLIQSQYENMLYTPRFDEPLGRHTFFSQFAYRNGVVTALQTFYPSVNFETEHYIRLSAEQQFDQWCRYKLHWIIPVLNDIPLRVFDALISGGIPLVPDSLRFSRWLNDIGHADIVYYSIQDILEPQTLVRKACRLFDDDGETGILRRHRLALERHHGDVRIDTIFNYAAQLFEMPNFQTKKIENT